MTSDDGSPAQTKLHSSSENLWLNDCEAIDMHEFHIQPLFIVDRIAVSIAKLKIVHTVLACPCEELLTLVIDHIHQVLDIIGISRFALELYLGGLLVAFSKLLTASLIFSFFYENGFALVALQL